MYQEASMMTIGQTNVLEDLHLRFLGGLVEMKPGSRSF